MTVYYSADDDVEMAINASKSAKRSLVYGWKKGYLSEEYVIKQMVLLLIGDIKFWWQIRQLKKSGHYDKDN